MASGEMAEPALLRAGGVSADAVTAGSAARDAVHGAAKQAAASKCPVKRQASRGASWTTPVWLSGERDDIHLGV